MTYQENVFWLAMLGVIFVAGLCLVCYYLGRAEGKEQAKEEYDRKLRARGFEYRQSLRQKNGRKPRIM